MARRYQLKMRADQQEETRLRIVEATVALHQQIGGPATTVSAIAERAGVERATVYRHFPDERTLLQACTGHYVGQNPPPNPQNWAMIEDAEMRLHGALTEIYAYHRRTEVMSARAVIDVPQMPTLRDVLAPMFAYWGQVRDLLAAPWQQVCEDHRLVTAAIGHAVAFQTWQSLARDQGLNDDEAVTVMMRMVKCVAAIQ
jgi:AcrR family transcriptional regulator